MPICYWNLCHCPDAQPCSEHSGLGCSRWGSQTIQSLSQVSDPITHDAELAAVALDNDQAEANRLRQDLERKKADLEREKNDLEQAFNSADSYSERRAVARRIEGMYDRLAKIQPELQQTIADLNTLNARASVRGALIGTYLIVPYSSASGYCACYTEKQNRLAAIASQRAAEVAKLTPLFAQRAAIGQQVLGLFSSLPNPANIFKITGSLTFVAMLIAFIFLGIKAALIALLIGLIVIAIILITMIILLLSIDSQIMAVRQRIVRLDLQYYRLQSISTCVRPAAGSSTTTGSGADENSWWKEIVGPEAPETPAPPPKIETPSHP